MDFGKYICVRVDMYVYVRSCDWKTDRSTERDHFLRHDKELV